MRTRSIVGRACTVAGLVAAAVIISGPAVAIASATSVLRRNPSTISGEGFEDLFGGLGPDERSWIVVPVGDPGAVSASRACTEWWALRRIFWSVRYPNQRSTWLIQDVCGVVASGPYEAFVSSNCADYIADGEIQLEAFRSVEFMENWHEALHVGFHRLSGIPDLNDVQSAVLPRADVIVPTAWSVRQSVPDPEVFIGANVDRAKADDNAHPWTSLPVFGGGICEKVTAPPNAARAVLATQILCRL